MLNLSYQRYANVLNLFLVPFLLVGAFLINLDVRGWSAEEKIPILLRMLLELEANDRKCNLLKNDERPVLSQMIEESLESISDKAQRDRLRTVFDPEKSDCAEAVTSGRFSIIVGEITRLKMRRQLESRIDALPTGRLKLFEGCWLGPLKNWFLKFCFSNGGDEVSALFTSDATKCQFAGGKARKRDGGAVFYGYAEIPGCSNRFVDHFEGHCPKLDKAMIICLISVYARPKGRDNLFFTVSPDSKDPLNGGIILRKAR